MKNLQHEQMRQEAINDIIECLENGYNDYYCDLHNEVFNTDYYVYGTRKAKDILNKYDVFNALNLVIEYDRNNFGEINTEITDPDLLLNMVYYIIGEEVVADIQENVEEFNEHWNDVADEQTNEAIIKYLNTLIDWKNV